MSGVARWSYTAVATVWRKAARDDWGGEVIWEPPRRILCDYAARAVPMTLPSGEAFVSRQQVYTEDAGVQPGDMILIGEYTTPNPLDAGAYPVRSVTRWADTFSRAADDYLVAT